jgi:hypothetical protein
LESRPCSTYYLFFELSMCVLVHLSRMHPWIVVYVYFPIENCL